MRKKSPRQDHLKRLAALRRRMVAEDVDLVLISEGSELRYLVGYTGSNGLLLVGRREADFLTDPRYALQARGEIKGATVSIASRDLLDHLPRLAALQQGRKKIGYDSERITEARAQKLRRILPRAIFIALADLVSSLTQVKDATEIALIEKAARIADEGFATILQHIKPGMREREIAAELEYAMQIAGSEAAPFETIVASGPRSALPHGRASMRRIRSGDFVTLDFGATVGGYVSDITRTVVVGKPSTRQKRIYDIVRRAQATGVRKARSGVLCSDLDRTVRKIIDRSGHGPHFAHGLGHGIGLAVHEAPVVNAKSNTVLKSGMVITIEPGIYYPGWGGVRIEDDIVIGRSGNRVLTQSDRNLVVL